MLCLWLILINTLRIGIKTETSYLKLNMLWVADWLVRQFTFTLLTNSQLARSHRSPMQLLILLWTGCAIDLLTSIPVGCISVTKCTWISYNACTDDHCRVKLKELASAENTDYINASYLDVRDLLSKHYSWVIFCYLNSFRVIRNKMLILLHRVK